MIRYILTDIEGTTTAIDFVHQVLFPYSRQRMAAFIAENVATAQVGEALAAIRQTLAAENGVGAASEQACVEALLHWIDTDRKHPALKQIQGWIWREGYESGAYRGHLYEDAAQCLRDWSQASFLLGIYSSGSVEAQQLLFRHSAYGDLTPLFRHYFDTAVGHKREISSYQQIQKAVNIPASEIVFLSDIVEELDAAQAAGFHTIQLLRPKAIASDRHKTARDFYEVHGLIKGFE